MSTVVGRVTLEVWREGEMEKRFEFDNVAVENGRFRITFPPDGITLVRYDELHVTLPHHDTRAALID